MLVEPVPTVRSRSRHSRGHGFGTGPCSFSGFQPYKTLNFKVTFPKLKFWESLGIENLYPLKRFNNGERSGKIQLYSKVWFNTPRQARLARLAAAQIKHRLQEIGIKPRTRLRGGGYYKLPIERASVRTNAALKIPRGLPRGGSFDKNRA
jgi:hypothetical protein